jgi:argininosuccinate lyase
MSSYVLATDLADYLVKKGLPFREAHGLVAELTKYASERGKDLNELSLKEYQQFSPLFDEDVYGITLEASINARNVFGGTAAEQVAAALARAKKLLDKYDGK